MTVRSPGASKGQTAKPATRNTLSRGMPRTEPGPTWPLPTSWKIDFAGYPAKSIFQLVGSGQVGPGSVRGMPLLSVLRVAGFAVWPFDAPGDRTVMEIYPTLLRKLVKHDGVRFSSPHERDATLSAAVMSGYRDAFVHMTAATDPVTLIEGDVWTPDAGPASPNPAS